MADVCIVRMQVGRNRSLLFCANAVMVFCKRYGVGRAQEIVKTSSWGYQRNLEEGGAGSRCPEGRGSVVCGRSVVGKSKGFHGGRKAILGSQGPEQPGTLGSSR